MSKIIRLLGLAAIIGAVTVGAALALTACKIYDPKKDISTLFITGNYQESRLMADLIQNETDQPYLLLPNSTDKRIYFIPSQRSKNPIPQEIALNDLGRFVRFLNVKDVCILGDERYVPQSYTNRLNKNMNVQRITNNNWIEVADLCQKRYNLNNLSYDYKRLNYEMKTRMALDEGESVRMGSASPYNINFTEPGTPSEPMSAPIVIEKETITEIPVVVPEKTAPAPVIIPIEEPIIEK